MTDRSDRAGWDGVLCLQDLPMFWQGRATALNLLNERRVTPDERTQRQIETYETCAKELRAALSAPVQSGVRGDREALREALEKLLSLNIEVVAGRNNYRPEDHIRIIKTALAETTSTGDQRTPQGNAGVNHAR